MEQGAANSGQASMGAPTQGKRTEAGDFRFLARQPILDRTVQLHGYELLFRAGPDAVFAEMGTESASQSIIDLALVLGAGTFTDGHPAYINCTTKHITSGILHSLPKELVVLEILEDVPAEPEIVAACRQLKAEGYTLAVDDIVSATDRMELVELASIIKVDFLLTDTRQQREIARRFARPGVKLLAEKVETREQFNDAVRMGYTLFQGYFFCRPETMRAKALPSSSISALNILRKAFEPEIDIQEMAEAIRHEPSLAYRLLRYMNAATRETHEVSSLVHALVMLGTDEIRKWVSIVVAVNLAGPRSKEMIRIALTRARFCELAAVHKQMATPDFYLTGLFSLLEALLDQPLAKIVEEIPIPEACREALQGMENEQGKALRLVMANETADWEDFARGCAELGCIEEDAWQWLVEAQSMAKTLVD